MIAMVNAGYEATVAPLGTALTADQLTLMWKMADEPTLCFDGDGAGRRAAYRAVDLALPLIKPGKSLEFASLPEGQDPDDLARAGGREAVNEVIGGRDLLPRCCGCGRPKPAGSIRRSGAPRSKPAWARSSPRSATIPCANTIARNSAIGCGGCSRSRRGPKMRQTRPNGEERLANGEQGGNEPTRRPHPQRRNSPFADSPAWRRALVVASPQLAASPVHRGHRAAIPRREAFILQTVINHPWLLHEHLEELPEVEFRHAEAARVKGELIDIFAHGGAPTGKP